MGIPCNLCQGDMLLARPHLQLHREGRKQLWGGPVGNFFTAHLAELERRRGSGEMTEKEYQKQRASAPLAGTACVSALCLAGMAMKKLINDPRNVVQELIEGFVLANERGVYEHPRVNAVIRKDAPVRGKVGIVIGGGAGELLNFDLAQETTCAGGRRMELFIVNRRIRSLLAGLGLEEYATEIGEFCTSQEMKGRSVTFFRLDEELRELYEQPCDSPFHKKV